MKKLDGFSLLAISICCCIFVSLGYVKLFHSVAQNVNKANTADFWQVRNMALKMRSPTKEARLAFSEGNLNVFDIQSLTDSSDHQVVDLAIKNAKTNDNGIAVKTAGFGMASWFNEKDEAAELAKSHAKFIDLSSEFAMDYNRELTRLINSH